MNNLFQANLSKSQIDTQNSLRSNIAFCDKLVSDLSKSFDVVVKAKRRKEDQFETTVYPPNQAGRYGYGFEFTASDQGVSFRDQQGLPIYTMAEILGVKISDKYGQEKNDFELMIKSLKLGKIHFIPNSGCGDHYCLELTLNEGPELNGQVKLIIGLLMAHGVTTKL